MLKLKLLTLSYFEKLWKNEKLEFLDFALVADDVIKVFDDIFIFETCAQVIFISYSL